MKKACWYRIALLGGLALLMVACNQVVNPPLPDDTIPPPAALRPVIEMQTGSLTALPTQEPDKDGAQMAQPTLPLSTSGLESLIEQAKEDLAHRLSISIAQINLVEAKGVVWPDSSMGCPQPGMAYLQVPEDGALIVLQVNGINYEYHNGGNRGLFLCEKIYKDPNPPTKIDIFNLTPSKSDSTTPDNSIPPGEDE